MTSSDTSPQTTLPFQLKKLQRRFLTTPKVCAASISKSQNANYNLPDELVRDAKTTINEAHEYLKTNSNSTHEERAAVESKLVDIKAHLRSTKKREIQGASSGRPSKTSDDRKPVLLKKQSTGDSVASTISSSSEMSSVFPSAFDKENAGGSFFLDSLKSAVGIKASQDIAAAFEAYSK